MKWCIFLISSVFLFAIANNFADTDYKHAPYNRTKLLFSNNNTIEFELTKDDDSAVSDEERGRVCLENITECMEKGEGNISFFILYCSDTYEMNLW